MVAVQPWWCFYFAAVLATRILGDLQCFGFVPVFFQPLEWQVACRRAAVAGRSIAYAGRLWHSEDAPPRPGANRGGETALTLEGGRSYHDPTWLHGCQCSVRGQWALGWRGRLGQHTLPKEANARARVEAESVLSDMRLAKTQMHTRIRLVR